MIKAKLPLPKPFLASTATRHSPSPSAKEYIDHILDLLKQCGSLGAVKQIHGYMVTCSIYKPNHLLAKVIRLKDLTYATLLFSRNPHPNDFSYNLMIRGLATFWSDYHATIQFYLRMIAAGERPNHYTYPFVLVASANLELLYYGQTAHASIFKVGLDTNDHIQHSLITMYSRCARLQSAHEVFEEITEKDSVSWNSMISGYAKMGLAGEAVALFRRMETDGFEPDEVTLVSVLAACGDLADLNLGKWLEGLVEEKRFDLNSFLGPSLIDMYGKCGDLGSARAMFDRLAKKDLVAWNAMITGYSQNGMSNEAIKFFYTMIDSGMVPDKITMIGVLSACGAMGALDLGSWLDIYARGKKLCSNVYVGTALIDMYAKCGNLDRALQVFESMPQKNIVSWNAMISAFASHGQGKEAILLFNQMKNEKNGLEPNEITFVGVLSACVHAGLVNEGRQLFHSMKLVYGITPTIEHYSCMVDLLARAGLLEEAWEFIEEMRGKPDAVVLGALLSACRYRKNVNIGEKVVKRILELEPSNSANYVISSKLYADSKMWQESARMRGLMRKRGVSKTPGSSWIEIDNQFFEFHSGDALHIRTDEIYEMIDILIEEMKREGYSPNTELP